MSTRRAPLALRATAPGGTLVTSAGRIPRLLLVVWALLLFNVLAPSANPTLVPIPRSIAQALAQGSLVLALGLALVLNRRLLIRPNHLLVLLSVLAVMSLVASLHNEFVLGSVYRGLRLIAFVTCLWLLTPWWGRRDMVLLRAHRLCLWGALGTVVIGAALAPGKAFSFEGRLSGAVWPMPPPQVAHYAAVLFGTSVILWMCRVITGRHALLAGIVTVGVLVGTHTRTAIAGAVVGLAIASASLFLGHARVRRVSASTLLGLGAAVLLFAPQIVTWLARGQSAQDATQLTGRTKVWSEVFATPRPTLEQFFGSGLSNKSFRGLAVDSNWVATYLDQGWFGIVVEAGILVLLLLMAATHVRGPRRAVALFLVVYCTVASFTETGLSDASPYLLDLVVAASLLVRPPQRVAP
ncbi:membrane protein [Fodinibacter luteus]|uniref:Membrane protein n=1 Tax=Fodinibacter luteus TaxID=552064 RepID=A0ABP8JW06_9MICO